MSAPEALPNSPAGEESSHPYWRRNMWVLSAACFCTAFGFTLPYPFMPFIVKALGAQGNLEAMVGYAVGGANLVTFVLTPIWGSVADYYGKRSMLLRAAVGLLGGFIVLAMAPGLGLFLPVYVLIGAFNGFLPFGMALVAANSPVRASGRAITTLHTGTLIGATLGPAIGAFLAARLENPQTLFWYGSVLFLLAGLSVLLWVRERHVPHPEPFRLSVFSDTGFLLRAPQVRHLLVVTFAFSATFWGATPIASLFTLELVPAGEYGGWSVETWVGGVTLGMTIATAAAMPVWGRLLDRYDPGLLLSISLVMATGCTLLVPFSGSPLWLLVARTLLGALGAGIQPAVVRLIKDSAPVGMDTRALALSTAVHMLAAGVAPIAAGWIAPVAGMPFYFALNCLLLAGASVTWILHTHRL